MSHRFSHFRKEHVPTVHCVTVYFQVPLSLFSICVTKRKATWHPQGIVEHQRGDRAHVCYKDVLTKKKNWTRGSREAASQELNAEQNIHVGRSTDWCWVPAGKCSSPHLQLV